MIKQMRIHGAHIIDIAHHVGCSERTVRRHLSTQNSVSRPPREKMKKLQPYMNWIDQRLREHVWNAEVIYQEIAQQGYTGCRTLLRKYIQPKRSLRPSKQTIRYETQPGEQLQHDWGEVDAVIAGQPCKISFAVNTLGYSRRFHVWATQSQDAEHTYESLVRAFNGFGGSVRTVLVDNQKAAVLRHSNSGEVVFNGGFLMLAKHYGFIPRACRPHRPRTKGKVERMVKYLKENFFVRYRRFDSLAHVNQQLEQWLVNVADERPLRYFATTPAERFNEERSALQSLPSQAFDTSYRDLRQVAWDGYIEVRGNRYSVPETLCGHPVSIRVTLDNELRVYADENLVASHQLKTDTHEWQTVPEHHKPLWQRSCSVAARPLTDYEELLK